MHDDITHNISKKLEIHCCLYSFALRHFPRCTNNLSNNIFSTPYKKLYNNVRYTFDIFGLKFKEW